MDTDFNFLHFLAFTPFFVLCFCLSVRSFFGPSCCICNRSRRVPYDWRTDNNKNTTKRKTKSKSSLAVECSALFYFLPSYGGNFDSKQPTMKKMAQQWSQTVDINSGTWRRWRRLYNINSQRGWPRRNICLQQVCVLCVCFFFFCDAPNETPSSWCLYPITSRFPFSFLFSPYTYIYIYYMYLFFGAGLFIDCRPGVRLGIADPVSGGEVPQLFHHVHFELGLAESVHRRTVQGADYLEGRRSPNAKGYAKTSPKNGTKKCPIANRGTWRHDPNKGKKEGSFPPK